MIFDDSGGFLDKLEAIKKKLYQIKAFCVFCSQKYPLKHRRGKIWECLFPPFWPSISGADIMLIPHIRL